MAKLSDYVDQGSSTAEIKLLDSITTSATATYALTKNGTAYSPDSARNLIVSLNGVTQAPQDAYTVSGSNIVFDSALTSADVIDYILVIGSAISIGTPSEGTVGTAQMSYPLGSFSSTGIDDNATSTAVTINSSEYVGVGTTNPADLVTLSGSGPQPAIRLITDAGTYNGVYHRIFPAGDGTALAISADKGNSGAGSYIRFDVDDTERMRIDGSGNVGIGTTSPVAGTKLTLNDSAFGGMQFQSGGSDCGYIGVNTNTLYIGGGEKIVFHTGNAQAVDGSSRMRIDSNGKLLINRSSATGSPSMLSLQQVGGNFSSTTVTRTEMTGITLADNNGSSNKGTGIWFDSGSLLAGIASARENVGNWGTDLRFYTHPNTTTNVSNTYERMRITPAGQLILRAVKDDTTSDSANMNIRSADGLVRRVSSSRRYKNSIVDSPHGLNELLALRSVRYKGNNDGDKIFGGFIAEEVHEAGLTEFVQYNEENEPDALAYAQMVALCTKAIQEQQAIIEELQTRLSALEAN
jgi:hypothetical protein